jgi:hypothetical protein
MPDDNSAFVVEPFYPFVALLGLPVVVFARLDILCGHAMQLRELMHEAVSFEALSS